MIEMLALFAASFTNVFLLGLNSQFVRDKYIAGAVFLSFNISISGFIFTRVVSSTENIYVAFGFSSVGSALGISSSIVFYTWLEKRRAK